MMRKLRWAMDGGGFWEVDVSTPITPDGVARPVPGDPLPLGMSRGARLSRPKQIDFFQRFMAMPFVPSFSPISGLSIQRVLSLPVFPFARHHWFPTLLGQVNIQKFVSSIKEKRSMQSSVSSWLQSITTNLQDKSLYALHFCSELLITPDDTLLVSSEVYGDEKKTRNKAVLHHKFPHHNLTMEAAWPGLFIDQNGSYWDMPLTMAIDLASVSSDSGASYHLCVNHTAGSPRNLEVQSESGVPATLLPGTSAKGAISFLKYYDIWRSEVGMLKMVQPYDVFLSIPHVSVSSILGAVVTASLGENSVRAAQAQDDGLGLKKYSLCARRGNSAILADLFASVSLSAQYGNFQRMFLDLTRLNACLDFPSGSKFLAGATRLAQELYNSQEPSFLAVQAMCPQATVSFQQQLAGPFSFRIDSGVALDLKKRDWYASVKEPIFALEYALQVLGSAKAIAWYSPKQQEFMIELRFFET